MKILIATLAFVFISACVPKEKDAILYRIEHRDKSYSYVHESGRITDMFGNVRGYIE